MAELLKLLNEQDFQANGPWDRTLVKKNVSMSHS